MARHLESNVRKRRYTLLTALHHLAYYASPYYSLASPGALLEWIKDLRLVNRAICIGLRRVRAKLFLKRGFEQRRTCNERAARSCYLKAPWVRLAQHHYIVDRLLPFDPATNNFLHLIKRVNWLNLLSQSAVSFLGGSDRIAGQLEAEVDIKFHNVSNGLAIEAGPSSQIGDVANGDVIPLYRKVAGMIRPVRMETIRGPGNGFPDQRAQEWLEAFNAEHPVTPDAEREAAVRIELIDAVDQQLIVEARGQDVLHIDGKAGKDADPDEVMPTGDPAGHTSR